MLFVNARVSYDVAESLSGLFMIFTLVSFRLVMVFSIFLGNVNQSKLRADPASFPDIALVLIPCHLLLLSACLLVAWKTFALDRNFLLILKFY